jgi:hypothetical protein
MHAQIKYEKMHSHIYIYLYVSWCNIEGPEIPTKARATAAPSSLGWGICMDSNGNVDILRDSKLTSNGNLKLFSHST